MNNTELFSDENSSKLVQKLGNLTINLGEDNQDVLNIDSSVYVNNIERQIPDEFKTTDKNKYLIVNTKNNYKYVDLNLDNSKFRFHKICSEKGGYDNTTDNSSGNVTPTDGDIHLKMNETMLIFLNFSAFRNSGLVTWTFKYRIKGTGTYLAFDYPEQGQFKHYYNAASDHQHRSGQIVFNSSSQDIIIDSFAFDFTNAKIDGNDFLSMNALIIPNNYLKSFTLNPDKPLAGAGGTEPFEAYGLYGNNATDVVTGTDGGSGSHGHYWNTYTEAEHISNNDITADVAIRLESTTTPVGISYKFTTPQIITKYRIWMHSNSSAALAKTPKQWELRASKVDKSTYDSQDPDTYDVLDSQENVTTYPYITGNNGNSASNNLNLANEYNLSNIKAYEYYVLHVISIQSNDVFSISELALYGDGLSIPEQYNNAGSELITTGTLKKWNKPTTNNLIGIDNNSAYNAVTINKDNTALTCMSNNEVIQLPSGSTRQRPNITKNGQIRYNTTTSCYEIYKENSWKKIITSDISINNQINTEVSDSSYYNQLPAPYSASICLLHRDFNGNAGDGRYMDGSPYTSYGAYVNVQYKENNVPIYGERFGRYAWYENSFDTIIYDTSPEQNMAYVRRFQPGDNPVDTVIIGNNQNPNDLATSSDTWNGGGIVIRKSGTYIMYYSSSIGHYGSSNEEFYTAFYKNDTLISKVAGRTTKTINGIGHNFIDKNYTAYLQEGDLIRIRIYHTRNSHTIYGIDNMSSYDYNDPTNPYNYDYMLKIASKLTVRLLDSTSLGSGGGGGGGGGGGY